MNVQLAQIQVGRTEYRNLTQRQQRDAQALLGQVFPVNTTLIARSTGLSTSSVTPAVKRAMLAAGFAGPKNIVIRAPTGNVTIQPDFLSTNPHKTLGIVSAECQLALRESVAYDFLKHAELQKRQHASVAIEFVPGDGLCPRLPDGCASFVWALGVLDVLVLPRDTLRVALVGLELV